MVRQWRRSEGQLCLRQDVDGGVARLGEATGVGLVRLQVRHNLMIAYGDATAIIRDAVASMITNGYVAGGSMLADGDVAGCLLMFLFAPLDHTNVAGHRDIDVLRQLRLVHKKLVSTARMLQDVRQKLLLVLLQLFLWLGRLFGNQFELLRVGPRHVRRQVFLASELLAAKLTNVLARIGVRLFMPLQAPCSMKKEK